MLAGETFPYSAESCLAVVLTCWSIARRSFKSSSKRPLSSATLKVMLSTPDCTSLRSSSRESSSGPISEMVVRTGWPCSPNTSQNTVGHAAYSKLSFKPSSSTRLATRTFSAEPARQRPERSPLMSARKTGTPMRLKASASRWSVTVLPVPVAPATSPCRFAIAGRSRRSQSPLPARSGSTMIHRAVRVGRWVQFMATKKTTAEWPSFSVGFAAVTPSAGRLAWCCLNLDPCRVSEAARGGGDSGLLRSRRTPARGERRPRGELRPTSWRSRSSSRGGA